MNHPPRVRIMLDRLHIADAIYYNSIFFRVMYCLKLVCDAYEMKITRMWNFYKNDVVIKQTDTNVCLVLNLKYEFVYIDRHD